MPPKTEVPAGEPAIEAAPATITLIVPVEQLQAIRDQLGSLLDIIDGAMVQGIPETAVVTPETPDQGPGVQALYDQMIQNMGESA